MKILFFASDRFALRSLDALAGSGQSIAAVITQPDKRRGRGLALSATPVKERAQELGLQVHQPEELRKKETVDLLKSFNADMFVLIAYGQILPQEALDIPKLLALNIHASLLPKYRGAAPINRAIINGEEATGVSAIKMVKNMDAGPILGQKRIKIANDDDALTLEDKLSKIAAELLLEVIADIEKGDCKLSPQQEKEATFAPKLKKDDGKIIWSRPAEDIHNLVRGALGWPGAFTHYKGKLLKIYKARVREAAGPGGAPGEIVQVSAQGLAVAANPGSLIIIEELQLEGKRRMKAAEFIQGHKIMTGEKLEIDPGIGTDCKLY